MKSVFRVLVSILVLMCLLFAGGEASAEEKYTTTKFRNKFTTENMSALEEEFNLTTGYYWTVKGNEIQTYRGTVYPGATASSGSPGKTGYFGCVWTADKVNERNYRGGNGKAIECAGMGKFIAYLLTGSTNCFADRSNWDIYKTDQGIPAIDAAGGYLKVGDVIQTNGASHTAVVHEVSGSTVSVVEAYGSNNNFINVGPMSQDKNKAQMSWLRNNIEYVYRAKANTNPYDLITHHGSDDAGFYWLKTGCSIKDRPYTASDNVGSAFQAKTADFLTTTDLFEATEKVENSDHQIWMKVKAYDQNDNKYITGYVKSDCIVFLYRKADLGKRTAYMPVGTVIRTLPVESSRVRGSIDFWGKTQDFEGSYQDKDGNIWYEISGHAGYVAAKDLKNIEYTAPELSFTGASAGTASNPYGYPTGDLGTIDFFGLRGTVKCSEALRSVTGRIINQMTNENAQEATVNTSSSSYVINSRGGINDQLVFGDLGTGFYRYEISAVTSSGYSAIVHTSEFSIGETGTAQPSEIKIQSLDILFGGFSIPKGEVTLDKYDERSIGCTLSVAAVPYPENATNQNIIWTSTNPSVTEPVQDPYDHDSRNVNLKLKGIGTTIITAATQDGSGKTVSFTVTVNCLHSQTGWQVIKSPTSTEEGQMVERCFVCYEALSYAAIPTSPIPVNSIYVPDLPMRDHDGTERPYLELKKYKTVALNAVANPTTAACKGLTYESSNENVAVVDESGNVYGSHTGNAVITISSTDGSGVAIQVDVTVISPESFYRLGINPMYNPPVDAESYVEVVVDKDDEESHSVWVRVRESGYYTITASGEGLKRELYVWKQYPLPNEALEPLKKNGKEYVNVYYLESYQETGKEYTIGISSADMSADYPMSTVAFTLQKNPVISAEPVLFDNTQTVNITQPGGKAIFKYHRSYNADLFFRSNSDMDVIGTIYDAYGNIIATNADVNSDRNFMLRHECKANTLLFYEAKLRDPNATGSFTTELRPYYPVSKIMHSYYNNLVHIEMEEGPKQLECWVSPGSADNQDVVFEEIDNEICSVSRNGSVVPYGDGQTTVRVWAEENPSVYSELTIEIYNPLGSNIQSIYSDGRLLLTGNGSMREGGTSASARPWFSFRSDIQRIILEQGITSINDYAFAGCNNAECVIIPQSVTYIAQGAFSNCNSLQRIFYRGTEAQWTAISIGANNEALTSATVYCSGTSLSPDYTLPSELEIIESEAFKDIPGGTSVSISNTVTEIAEDAFDENVVLFVPSEIWAQWADENGYNWTIK